MLNLHDDINDLTSQLIYKSNIYLWCIETKNILDIDKFIILNSNFDLGMCNAREHIYNCYPNAIWNHTDINIPKIFFGTMIKDKCNEIYKLYNRQSYRYIFCEYNALISTT